MSLGDRLNTASDEWSTWLSVTRMLPPTLAAGAIGGP